MFFLCKFSQIQQLEESCEAELEDVKAVSEEYSKRIAESEKRMSTVLREKEALKRSLQEVELEIGKR